MPAKRDPEPEQYGEMIKFGQHRTQLAPTRIEPYLKPWRVEKAKKKKKIQAPEMSAEAYQRLHRNAVTFEISE